MTVISLLYQEQAFAKVKRTGSMYSFDGKMEPEPLYEEDEKKIAEREAYVAARAEESEKPIEREEPTEVIVDVPTNPSFWKKTQTSVAGLVNSSAFETLITLCILFNTLAMALEHFQMDETFAKVLEYCNLVGVLCRFFSKDIIMVITMTLRITMLTTLLTTMIMMIMSVLVFLF